MADSTVDADAQRVSRPSTGWDGSLGDPETWLKAACWLVIVLSATQILMFSFGRDQGIYAAVAEGIVDGRMPYRDVWDFKPPGIFLIFALAQALFGKTMLGVRILEVTGLIATVFAFQRLGGALTGRRSVGLIAAAVAAHVHAQLEFWHTAQPETFGGYLTVWALALTVTHVAGPRRWRRYAVVGVLFGVAFLFKPPLGGGALVCAAYAARHEMLTSGSRKAALKPFVVMGLSSLAPIALCGLWFVAKSAWTELYWTLFVFTPGYTALGWENSSVTGMYYHAFTEGFFKYSALLPAGVVAAIALLPAHFREREGVFLVVGVIAMHLAGIAMQGKFFPYHYGATLPLIAFVSAIGIRKVWSRCTRGGFGGVLAFFSFVGVLVVTRSAVRDVPGTYWQRTGIRMRALLSGQVLRDRKVLDKQLYFVADYNLQADRDVALELKRSTEPGDPVFVWGFEPAIYWISDRPAGTRFVYNVPQRVSWDRSRARAELLKDLDRTRPKMFVVQRNDVFPFVTGDTLDSRGALGTFPELMAVLQQRYELVKRIEDFDIYKKRVARSASRGR